MALRKLHEDTPDAFNESDESDTSATPVDIKDERPAIGTDAATDMKLAAATAARSDVEAYVESAAALSSVPDGRGARYDRLSPIRCYNYRTQLTVAGRLVTESLEAGNSAVLVLDKNAEEALDTLETLGFTLRRALLERRLDIFYYRRGVRDRTFFLRDYEAIFDELLRQRLHPVQHVIMIEFNTLFANAVQAAVGNQIEDFCNVARSHDVAVWGLYSPPSWSQDDFLSERLPGFLGRDCLRQAQPHGESGRVQLSAHRIGHRADATDGTRAEGAAS